MRIWPVVVSILLISPYGIAQQGGGRGRGGGRGQAAAEPPAPANPGFECFANVVTPDFPESALLARVDGTVYAFIQVTPQGAADKIDSQVASAWQDGPKLLTPAVEKAIRASKFKPECAGKTVAVVYRYDLLGEATAKPAVKTRTEGNILFIDSQPESKPAVKTGAAK
jgi:hypothetical protein